MASDQSSGLASRGGSKSEKHTDIKEQNHVEFTHPHMRELLTLADLAGVTAPEKVMKVMIEFLALGVDPSDCHALLRAAVSSRKPGYRSSTKHSSKRPQSETTPSASNV